MGSKKRFFGCRGNRKKRADEGIGPYKVQKKIAGGGRTESSALTGCSERVFTENS